MLIKHVIQIALQLQEYTLDQLFSTVFSFLAQLTLAETAPESSLNSDTECEHDISFSHFLQHSGKKHKLQPLCGTFIVTGMYTCYISSLHLFLQDSLCQKLDSGMNISVSLNFNSHKDKDNIKDNTLEIIISVCVLLSETRDLLHYSQCHIFLRQKQCSVVRS